MVVSAHKWMKYVQSIFSRMLDSQYIHNTQLLSIHLLQDYFSLARD